MRTVTGPDRPRRRGGRRARRACPRRCGWPAPAARSRCWSARRCPGGRAGLLAPRRRGLLPFDTGPTVLTMPDLIADALDCVGERLADWLTLRPGRPRSTGRGSPTARRSTCTPRSTRWPTRSPACAGRPRRPATGGSSTFVSQLYRLEMRDFIDRNIDSPLDLVRPSLARLAAIGGFRRLAPKVAQFLPDERTQRVFSFQAMYAGLSPYDALALYAVIAYMDSVAGVFFPRGRDARGAAGAGRRRPRSTASSSGTATEVTRVELRGRPGRGGAHRRPASGSPCDAVVLNPDLPVAYRELLGCEPRRLRRLSYSPSCFLLLGGSTTRVPGRTPTTRSRSGTPGGQVFDEILGGPADERPVVPRHRSPTRVRPVAGAGRPVRSTTCCSRRRTSTRRSTGGAIGAALPRARAARRSRRAAGRASATAIEVEHVTTPAGLGRRAAWSAGTPFAAAHTFGQTGPFRPRNLLGRERRVRRLGHAARRRRADGAGLGPAGRRAHRSARIPSYRSRAWR